MTLYVFDYNSGLGAPVRTTSRSGEHVIGVELDGPATWASTSVSGATNGDNELVAAVAGQQIHVVGLHLVAQGDVEVTLESDTTGPDLTGPISLPADGDGFVWPVTARGWYVQTDTGESLNMRLNAAVLVAGVVTYYTA